MRPLTTLLLAGALALTAAAPAAAQDASPMPIEALDLCTLLPLEEAVAIEPGVAYASATPSEGTCLYETAAGDADYGSLTLAIEDGDAGMMGGFLGGEETTVAGHEAWVGGMGAFVALTSRFLSVNGYVTSIADPAPYWTAIAEVVVPRIPEAAYGAPPPDLSGVGPICPLLDGATVGGILDVEIGRVEGDDVGCTYTTPDSTIMSDGFVTVNVRYDRGGLALIRSAFPDGETLQVDGRDAWWSSSITILWVDRGGDDTTTVQFVMSADDAATLEHAVAIVQALDAAGG